MGIIMNSRARRLRQREEPRERTWARREFKTHTIRPAEVRSFTFRRASGDSNHWFRLTWTPGHLTLVGDIGEMVLTHYSALADFEGGLRWAARADYHYLMEKSDKATVKELDRAETARDIIHMMTEEAAWCRVEELREARRYRRAIQRATADWEQAMAAWQHARPQADEEDRPRLLDEWPEAEPRARFERASEPTRRRAGYIGYSGHLDHEMSRWIVPDGWAGWLRLMLHLQDRLDFDDPNELLRPRGRRAVRRALEGKLEEGMHEGDVAEFCREIDLDDYYGAYRYNGRTIWQIEAVQHGCNLILDQLEPSRTWGKTWGDPVV